MTYTDPGAPNTNPNTGPPLDLEMFSNLIGYANSFAAMEFLTNVKANITTAAAALTYCRTPEVRKFVQRQLFESLDMHEKLSELMMAKGWLLPYNLTAQFQVDINVAEMTASIAELPLFKDRTKVEKAFDTPT